MTDTAPATGSPAAEPGAVALSPRTRASLRLVSWLIASWALLLVVGVLSLRAKDALGASNPVSFSRAVFVSSNVGSLAGFAADFAKPDDFAAPARAVFVMQTLSGLLLGLVGGGVLLARLLGRPYSDGRLTLTAILMTAIAAVVGCLSVTAGESVVVAALRGVTALGCGGVLFGDPPHAGLTFSLLLVPLSIIGSLGVVVVNDLLSLLVGRKDETGHTSCVLTVTAIVYLVGLGVMTLVTGPLHDSWPAAMVRNNALFWQARGWGTPTEFATRWPADLLWPVLAIIVIGAGTAGSAGSIGLAWLLTVPAKLRSIVLNGLVANLLLASACLAALVLTEPTIKPIPRLLLVASAVMNIGLSHQPISITGTGLLALGVTIAIAKVLPLFILAFGLRSKDLL